MGFIKKLWKNRISEFINRRILTDERGVDTVVFVARDEGEIVEEGDAFNAANMNDLEERIASYGAELEETISANAELFANNIESTNNNLAAEISRATTAEGALNTSLVALNTSVGALNTELVGVKGVTDRVKFVQSADLVEFGLIESGDTLTYFDLVHSANRNRVVFSDNGIVYQHYKNGVFVKNYFDIYTNPIVYQMTFINGATAEPTNCNVINYGNFAIINISGFTCETSGALVIAELDFFNGRKPACRANVTSGTAIFFMEAGSTNLNVFHSAINAYIQLYVPLKMY